MRFSCLLLLTTVLFAGVDSIRELIRSGRNQEAIAECDRELRAAPKSAALLTLKGLALMASGEKPKALTALRQALQVSPTYPAALQAAAQLEFEARDRRALTTLNTILKLDPSSQPAHAMRGTLLFEAQRCDEAITDLEQSGPALNAPAIKWPYAVCLMDAARWQDAAQQFASLLALKEHAPTRFNLALAKWNAKHYTAVVETLQSLDDPESARLIASAHEALHQTPQAFAALQQALAKSPNDERLLIDLASLCMDHNAIPLGLEVVRAAIEQSPKSARLHTLLGVLLVRGGEAGKGQQAFQTAQQLSPESGLGQIGLASTMMQMGLASDAVALLERQQNRDAKTELTLARALLLKGATPAELQREASKLKTIAIKEPAAHGILGKIYLQTGDIPSATQAFESALRLDPNDRASAHQLMMLYQKAGRRQDAAALAVRIRSMLAKEKSEEQAANRFEVVRAPVN